MRRRTTMTLMLIGVMLFASVPAAFGSITEGEDICDGWAEIEGVRYTPDNDTPGNAIPIPDEEGVQIQWYGEANMPNTNGSGAVYVNVAGIKIEVDDWVTNDAVQVSSSGVYALDDFYEELDARVPIGRIPGVWRVEGEHSADGGDCAGFVMIKLEGNPLGTLVGWVTVVGLIVAGAGLVFAFRARVPVRTSPPKEVI